MQLNSASREEGRSVPAEFTEEFAGLLADAWASLWGISGFFGSRFAACSKSRIAHHHDVLSYIQDEFTIMEPYICFLGCNITIYTYNIYVMRPGKAGILEIVNSLLERQATVRAGEVAEKAKVTRQAAHRHLKRLVEEGVLSREGKGRGACYRAIRPPDFHLRYGREGLKEEQVWEEMFRHLRSISPVSPNLESILQYAATELVNNAVDHSGGSRVEIVLPAPGACVSFEVLDDGVGIFEHLRTRLGLPDKLSAIQELSKGKVTTFPERHTGQGIFFSSKIADFFEIESDDLAWRVDNRRNDVSVGNITPRSGTRVRFEVDRAKTRSLKEVFDEYTEDFEFTRTRIVIKLFDQGSRFISRSEAKRVLHGLEQFKTIVLDFRGVTEIGQGFADEVFRVWPSFHRESRLEPVNMSSAVEFMVKRALPKSL